MRFIFPDNQWNTSRLSSLPPAGGRSQDRAFRLGLCAHASVKGRRRWSGHGRQNCTPAPGLSAPQPRPPRAPKHDCEALCVNSNRNGSSEAHLCAPREASIILISQAPRQEPGESVQPE